jgi:hypothetical protein
MVEEAKPRRASSSVRCMALASRSFIERLLHVSGSMHSFTDMAQGQRRGIQTIRGVTALKTKADIVAFVRQCVTDGGDLIKAKGDTGLNQSVNDGSSRLVRLGDLAYGVIEHSGEHYGQLVVYFRINGLTPPESRQQK